MRAWIGSELAPFAESWEASGSFPDAVIRACAEAGWIGLKFPVEHGGGGDPVAAAVFAEELARCGAGGVGAGIGAHAGIALPPVWRFGSDEQHARYLRPGIRGEKIAALGITEPDAGSDVAALRTRAERVDGGFLLNGSKLFITGGVRADFVVTAVKTTAEGGHGGISFLIVDTRDADGRRADGVNARPLEKLGWHASDTALLTFDDLFVPAENLLGELHGGFKLIMVNFAWERLMMSLGALGAVDAALEQTAAFLRERGSSQRARHTVAEVATTLEAGRALTYHALRLHLAGADCVREVTMAKLATQRAAFDAVDRCLQLHYDAGEHSVPLLERAARDLRLGPIGGGTDEIMREILGKSIVHAQAAPARSEPT
jgi:acyl-CoA dehydrogenase